MLYQNIKGCINLHPELPNGCEKFLVQKSGHGLRGTKVLLGKFKGYENIRSEIKGCENIERKNKG